MSTLPTKHSDTSKKQYFSTDDMQKDNTTMGKGNKPQKNDKATKKPKQVKVEKK
jgi:hypothetical protein